MKLFKLEEVLETVISSVYSWGDKSREWKLIVNCGELETSMFYNHCTLRLIEKQEFSKF